MNEAELYEQANRLWPIRLFPYQVARFLRAYKAGKFGQKTLAEAWEHKKLAHVSYWQDRYGLTDARPFGMKPAMPIVRASWEPNELLGLKVSINMLGQPKLALYMQASPALLEQKLGAYAKQYNLQLPSNAVAEFPSGQTTVFAEPLPEHDWLVWRQQQKALLEADNLVPKARRMTKLIREYKEGKSKASNLQELSELIREQACVPAL